ncbi:MAG: MarR family winged helix-turn-helix transcriptional regulator [Muricomes sp.]
MIKSEERVFSSCFGSISHILYYMSDQRLKQLGITHQQGRLLGFIYDNIKAHHEISRHYLEETMDLRGPTVTSLLKCLEEKDYVIRTVSKEDRRAMELIITPKGEKLISDIKEVFNSMEDKILEGMTVEETQTLKALLFKVYDNLLKP